MTSFVTTCKLRFLLKLQSCMSMTGSVVKGGSLGPLMSHMTTECIATLVNAGVNDPQLNSDVCTFWLRNFVLFNILFLLADTDVECFTV